MSKIFTIALFVVVIAVFLSAGCGTKGPSLPGGKNTTNTTKPTSSPTPTIGALSIISDPVGAKVYLNDSYKGVAPIVISDLPIGKYNLSLQLEDYTNYNTTVVVKGGQTYQISKILTEAKPKLELRLTNSSMRTIGRICLWTFIGDVKNIGDETIHDLNVTLEMNPITKDFDKVIYSIESNSLAPGAVKSFGFDIQVLCAGNYDMSWKYVGYDINNPEIESDDKKISGSLTPKTGYLTPTPTPT